MSSVGFRWGLRGVVLSVALGGCGGPSPAGEEGGQVDQAWSVSFCSGAEPDFAFSYNPSLGGGPATGTSAVTPAIITPQAYNTCDRAYVIDIHNLNVEYAGSSGGLSARLKASWAGPVATSQASCEDHLGGIIVYKQVGAKWVNLTGQVRAAGVWHPQEFFQAYCEEPALDFSNLVAGTSYRLAATMRIESTGATQKIRIENLKPVTVL